jgi:hypothetical protein
MSSAVLVGVDVVWLMNIEVVVNVPVPGTKEIA